MDIRDARPADEPGWRALWGGYQAHYGLTLPPEVTAHTWARILDPATPLNARLACEGGRVLGFALYRLHESTWVIGQDCYLEDLFVAPDSRGLGLGRALLDDLAALGRAQGWQRLSWVVDQDNASARRLYDSFVTDDGHIRYRMEL